MQATPSAAPEQRPTFKGRLQKHRARIVLAARVLTAVILMGIVISLVAGDWDQFTTVDWQLIPLALVLVLTSTVVKAVRWSLLVRQSQMHNMTLRYLLGTYLVGAFFSTVLPTSVGGDAVRAVDAANKSGRAADATSSVLIERGIGMLVVIGSGSLFAFLLEPNYLPIGFQLFVHAMFIGMLIGFVFLYNGWFIKPLITVLRRYKINRIADKLQGLQTAFTSHLKRPGVLVIMFLLSIIAHALTITATYIVLSAVTDPIPLGAFVPVIALTTAAEMIPISIASLGVKESAYVFFLGMVSVGSVEATVIALIMRGTMLARAAFGGIVFFARTLERKPQDPPRPPRMRTANDSAPGPDDLPQPLKPGEFVYDEPVPVHTPVP